MAQRVQAVDILGHDAMALRKVGDFLIGIPFTPMGGDWRDFVKLQRCCVAIDRMAKFERESLRTVEYYKDVEQLGSGDSD